LDPDIAPLKGTEYALWSCPRCNGPFLTKQKYLHVPEADFDGPQGDLEVLYPNPEHAVPEGTPEIVARPYTDAVRSYSAGLYGPCAVMCGKAVEALCRILEAKGANLFTKIRFLQENGHLDTKLVSWANQIRVIRNDAAHDLDMIVTKEDARDALEFLRALFLYVFELDERFRAFALRRKKDD